MSLEQFRREKVTLEYLAKQEIDSDVFPVILALNKFDFIFTILSCSGTPQEVIHKGDYRFLRQGVYGNPKGGHQGWVMLDADTLHSDFQPLKQGLETIEGVELTEKNEKYLRSLQRTNKGRIKEYLLQAFISEKILVPERELRPSKQLYLTNTWKRVYVFLESFYNKTTKQ